MLLRPEEKARGPLGGSSTGSTASSAARPTATSASRGSLIRKSAGQSRRCCSASALAAGCFGAQAPVRLPAGGRPGLSLRRRAAAQCRLAPAHRRGRAQKVEEILRNTPGVEVRHHRHRLQPAEQRAEHLQRLLLRHARRRGSERKKPEEQYAAIKAHLNAELGELPEGDCVRLFAAGHSRRRHLAAASPSCSKTAPGRTSTFLAENVDKFLDAARKRPEIAGVQHHVPAERAAGLRRMSIATRCSSRASTSAHVYQTLQTFMGGYFVNYFNRFGRQWQVYRPGRRRVPHEGGKRRPVLCAQHATARWCRSAR